MVKEKIVEKNFINSIAINVYHDGKEGLAQHFDDAVRFKQVSLFLFSPFTLWDCFRTLGCLLEVNFTGFATAPLSFHFREDAFWRWKRTRMQRTALSTVSGLATWQGKVQQWYCDKCIHKWCLKLPNTTNWSISLPGSRVSLKTSNPSPMRNKRDSKPSKSWKLKLIDRVYLCFLNWKVKHFMLSYLNPSFSI